MSTVLLLIICLTIYGCDRRYGIRVQVLEGQFSTPLGRFDVDNRSSPNSDTKLSSDLLTGFLQSTDERVTVYISVLPVSYLNKLTYDAELGESFELVSTEYDLSGTKFGFSMDDAINYSEYKSLALKPMLAGHFRLYLPSPLADLSTTVQGGSINGSTLERVRKNEDKVHNLSINFKLNNEFYTFDVKFKVIIDSSLTIGIPGGGV